MSLLSVWKTYGAIVSKDIIEHFGDPKTEFSALSESCALLDMSHFAQFALRHDDPKKLATFVDGLVSNNAKNLKNGQSMRAAFLTRFGKIVSDCDVTRIDGAFLITVPLSNAAVIDQLLGRGAMLAKVQLSDFGRDYARLRLLGPSASAIAAQCGGIQASMKLETSPPLDGSLVDIYLPWEHAPDTIARLYRHVTFAGNAALEMWRIAAGIPLWAVDFDASNVLNEVNSSSWVSFTKGCYVGQEIVAKVQSRGGPVKQIRAIKAENQISIPCELCLDETSVGKCTSAAELPDGTFVGIAMLKREAWSKTLTTKDGISVVER